MISIAIFASGNGSNAERIIQHFASNSKIKVALIVTNNEQAFVVKRAEKHNLPICFINTKTADWETQLLIDLKQFEIDFIVLAGFLKKIPNNTIASYPQKIINIHPALLPNYGGKGMYGMNVHRAVINDKCKESGITIHYVNDIYDDGEIIFQAKCPVYKNDTPEKLAERIHQLEHEFFPAIIEEVITHTFQI